MQHHLRVRLNDHAKDRWPQLTRVDVCFRTGFAYVAGELKDGEQIPLCRLRFTGALHTWGFWPAEAPARTTSCPPASASVAPNSAWTAPATSTAATSQPDRHAFTN
ncbi:hypothetical protein ACIRRH_43360 [Kitasatospora sp. NPDC101235]|uniref:hypothetical protein n=1 Tax=Kitasatospora sp. NPDC101235 TaxID=3364101 RepID=UPI003807F166